MEVTKEPDLTDGWWTSEALYSLEKRAIFSKTWICITHRSRFTKPGDYITLELAGWPILLILGKDKIVRAFHNVCRHRAYTITKKSAGSSLVLGCRYHGWSYNARGDLVKAPHFDGIEGFNKSENGLFKVHTCTDRGGFIYVNVNADPLQDAPDCDDITAFAAINDVSDSCKWITEWVFEGAFNWKTVGTTERAGIGIADFQAPRTWYQDIFSAFLQCGEDVNPTRELVVSPSTVIALFPDQFLWAMLTAVPSSATKCTVKVDIFSTGLEGYVDADIRALKDHFTSVIHALEQRYAELATISPPEDPNLLLALKRHLKLERLAGGEVHPERKTQPQSESYCKAVQVCKELDTIAQARVGLRTDTSIVRVDSFQASLDW